mgnify:CR=1 FL=1
MAYLLNTEDQQQKMLESIGADSVADLFRGIPDAVRVEGLLRLPPALTEMELEAEVAERAAENVSAARVCFLGGGAYDHFVPAVVDEIAARGEFYTAYTPYQPEASQGSLQAFFEYQTLICQLTGMEVANASLYEGGTAVSEAAFMAMRVTNRHTKVAVLGSVHPEYRQVLETYTGNLDCEVVTIPTPDGMCDLNRAAEALDERTACLIVQHPNFFGCLEDAAKLTQIAHEVGALSVVSFDPISLGVLKNPGSYGADIAVAEGQPLGIPMQYGGPYLGVLASKKDFVRKMPGRIVSEARDREGRACYVLGLQTREQHIRREKATSNICTNQGLLALRATVYLSLLGPQGLREAAELCCRKAHFAAEQLTSSDEFDLMFDRPFFKEFTLRCRGGAAAARDRARASGFDVGPELSRFSSMGSAFTDEALLVAVTEQRTREEIDELASVFNVP